MKSYLMFALKVAVALVIVNLVLDAVATMFPPIAFLTKIVRQPFSFINNPSA